MKINTTCPHCNLHYWQCPNVVFGAIGIITILLIYTVYGLMKNLLDSFTAFLIVSGFSIIMLVVAFVVSRGLEYLAYASKMKSEFINILSHQIKSPLSNIQWVCELLESGKLGGIGDKQLEYIKGIKDNVQKLKRFANDVVLLSDIEAGYGKPKLNLEKFSILDIINNVVSTFSQIVKERNIKIQIEGSGNIEIISDKFFLREAIKPVVENAIHYSKEGGNVILRLSDKPKNVVLEVIDSGIGIPKEDKKFIFNKFFRASNARKHKTEGSGLGLYISKNILKFLGGKIKFESSEGKGSKFFIIIPKKII